MPNVKFFIHEYEKQYTWRIIVEELKERGIEVYTEPFECDTAIVLSGMHTNPMVFKNRKILFTAMPEWGNLWLTMFKPVLEEYYDEITEMPPTLTGAIDLLTGAYKREGGIEAN